jgi:hypothetical protein
MLRTVPSQIVTYLNRTLPEGNWGSIGPAQVGELAGLIQLIDQLPGELLTLNGEAYADFIAAVSRVQEQVTTWSFVGQRVHS